MQLAASVPNALNADTTSIMYLLVIPLFLNLGIDGYVFLIVIVIILVMLFHEITEGDLKI